jgi:hypothetical protein
MQRAWHRLGRLPSVVATLALYGLLVPVGLLLPNPVDQAIAVGLLGVFTLYCTARPHHRVDVFLYAFAPSAGGELLHDIFDISRHWGLLAVALVLVWLREIDRDGDAPDKPDDVPASPEPA